MEKSFNPAKFEADIYKKWMDKGYFKADENSSKQPFTIVMPPPNITSKLHIGHAYGISIMDSIIRYKRMQGFEALLLPGTDHAAQPKRGVYLGVLQGHGWGRAEGGIGDYSGGYAVG